MIPKIKFKFDFNSNFAAFILHLFEDFPGCTEYSLNLIKKSELKEEINKIKKKQNLEDDENFIKRLMKNPRELKKKISRELFQEIYSNYTKYFKSNKKVFEKRKELIYNFIKKHNINEVLREIPQLTKINWKHNVINVFLVDIYYYRKEKEIDGTTTKEGIFIGLPQKPINAFNSVFYHELIHINIIGSYNENKEELIAQILGIKISKLALGKVPKQMIKIAKRRIKEITGQSYEKYKQKFKN